MTDDHNNEADKKHVHVSGYFQHGLVLLALLTLTFITVFIAEFHFGALAVVVAMVVASIKGTTVLTYFMHLKFENLLLRLMVFGVFLLYALVIIITFIDYLFR